MPKIELKGLYKLTNKLKENVTLDDVKQFVKKHGEQLQRKSQKNANFKGHYGWVAGKGRTFIKPTGNLKDSIMLEFKDGGMTAEVEPTAEYAPYVEFGTRFMDAQPYLKPSWEEQKEKFKRDMDKLVR